MCFKNIESRILLLQKPCGGSAASYDLNLEPKWLSTPKIVLK
jgi:hypothetical protein